MISTKTYDRVGDLSVFSVTDVSKRRRLMDIKRGRGYLRTIDDLAYEQWTAYGKTPIISSSAPDFSLGPVNTKDRHSKEGHQHSRGNSKKVLLDISKRTGIPGPEKAHSSGFTGVPQGKRYSSQRKGAGRDDCTDCFNTWGSREWDYEDKLVPESYPRIIMPKQGVMMSRVAKNKNNRRFRTNTDFRSRNGTIRIINPPKPLPSIDETGGISVVDGFNPDSLKREQTYQMLKRIDQLLHPNRVIKGDVTSSQIENHSTISSLTDSVEEKNVLYNPNNMLTRRKTFLQNGLNKRPKTKDNFNSQLKYSSFLSAIAKQMENSEVDGYHKCEQWVHKYSVHFPSKPSS